MGIVFLLDSGSDYEQENQVGLQHEVEVIPLNIHFPDKDYLDGVTISKDEFYKKMESEAELPKTSQPSPQAFFDAYKKYIKENNEIICITISSLLSGTYQSASIAKDMLSEEDQQKVHLVDSENVSVTILYMAKKAEQLLLEGASAQEAVTWLEENKKKIIIFALLDTLENLKKGGRISSTQAFIGELLSIKPLVTVKDGKVDNLGKFRGRKKGLKEIANVLGDLQNYHLDHLFVVYNSDSLEESKQELELIIDPSLFEHVYYYKLGSTIGTHSGKNAVGVCLLEK